MTLAAYFAGDGAARKLFDALSAIVEQIGPAQIQVTRSQVAFRRRKAFAWAWRPAQYLGGERAPLVLTLGFRHRDTSPRWKEIVEPRPGYFTHHLELHAVADLDDEVRAWLSEAWAAAG